MASLPTPAAPGFPDVYQIELLDRVKGGAGGTANRQAEQLVERTAFLRARVEAGDTALLGHIAANDPHPAYWNDVRGDAKIAAAIAALVSASPATLDTLAELANALGNDPNFATTMLNALAGKADLAGATFSGPIMVPTAAQFDATTRAANMQSVQRALGSFRGWLQVNAPITLTAALHAGIFVQVVSAGAVTLPLASTCPSGTAMWIENTHASPVTVQRQGSDNLYTGGTLTPSVSLSFGDSMLVVSSGINWYVIGGSVHLKNAGVFAGSLTPNGYQPLPNGLIFQWGVASASTGGSLVFFPIPFPNQLFGITLGSAAGSAFVYCLSQNNSGFTFYLNAGGASSNYWFAIGR